MTLLGVHFSGCHFPKMFSKTHFPNPLVFIFLGANLRKCFQKHIFRTPGCPFFQVPFSTNVFKNAFFESPCVYVTVQGRAK